MSQKQAKRERRAARLKAHQSELITSDFNMPGEIVTQQVTAFSGPIPPPDVLEAYKLIFPDAPEKIFQFTESELQHVQSMERDTLRVNELLFQGQLSDRKRMQWMTFVTILVLIGTAIGLFAYDKNSFGAVLAVVAALIPIFGQIQNKDNRETKNNKRSKK